jgi:hypothetical protein
MGPPAIHGFLERLVRGEDVDGHRLGQPTPARQLRRGVSHGDFELLLSLAIGWAVLEHEFPHPGPQPGSQRGLQVRRTIHQHQREQCRRPTPHGDASAIRGAAIPKSSRIARPTPATSAIPRTRSSESVPKHNTATRPRVWLRVDRSSTLP